MLPSTFPQLAYIGFALINHTLINPTTPNVTPRGVGYFDIFNSGVLYLADAPLVNPLQITAFEANLAAAPSILDIVPGSGGDYFTHLQTTPYAHLGLDSHAVATVRGRPASLVRLKAGGHIMINEKVGAILQRTETAASMQYGETEFWEPIFLDSGDKGVAWLNTKLVFSQGRLLVEDRKAYGFELRLFTVINGKGGVGSILEKILR